MTEKVPEVWVCNPCRSGHHLECDGNQTKPCDCLVCAGERIGDQVMGDGAGDRRGWHR